jgi:hypothetical protein
MTCECSLCHKTYENKTDGKAMHFGNQAIWTCPACRKAGRTHKREDVEEKINREMMEDEDGR